MQILQLLGAVLMGAVLGGAAGYFGKCTTGACPLTANPLRGALVGAVFGLMFGLSVVHSGERSNGAAGPAGTDADASAGTAPSDSKVVAIESAAAFDASVRQASGLVVVDFYADWCPPCKMLAPIFAELADEYADRVTFAKINVDRNSELAREFKVRGIPHLAIFRDGQAVAHQSGFMEKRKLELWVNEHLEKDPAR